MVIEWLKSLMANKAESLLKFKAFSLPRTNARHERENFHLCGVAFLGTRARAWIYFPLQQIISIINKYYFRGLSFVDHVQSDGRRMESGTRTRRREDNDIIRFQAYACTISLICEPKIFLARSIWFSVRANKRRGKSSSRGWSRLTILPFFARLNRIFLEWVVWTCGEGLKVNWRFY